MSPSWAARRQSSGRPLIAIIRDISRADRQVVAAILREVMSEYDMDGPGYSSADTEIDDMYAAYQGERSAFFVVERDGTVLGCGGIAPLAGAAADTCELRKMYFLKALRGEGMGPRLLDHCIEAARRLGFRTCYLETLSTMEDARRLYAKYGFRAIDKPLGNTGHSACNHWMVMNL